MYSRELVLDQIWVCSVLFTLALALDNLLKMFTCPMNEIHTMGKRALEEYDPQINK